MLLHFKVIRELSENYREDTLQPVTKKSNRFHVLHTVAPTFTHQSQFEYVMSMSLSLFLHHLLLSPLLPSSSSPSHRCEDFFVGEIQPLTNTHTHTFYEHNLFSAYEHTAHTTFNTQSPAFALATTFAHFKPTLTVMLRNAFFFIISPLLPL